MGELIIRSPAEFVSLPPYKEMNNLELLWFVYFNREREGQNINNNNKNKKKN